MPEIPELGEPQVEGEENASSKQEEDEPLVASQVIVEKEEEFIDLLHASKNSNISTG
jgi:hypothetical protein